jgi:putative holliday junction resolvase
MNYLALDYGSRKVGLAYKIGDNPIVPSQIIDYDSAEQLFTRLQQIASEKQINQIVLGLPLTLAGKIGPQATAVQEFGTKLQQLTGLPLEYSDERLTSKLFPDQPRADSLVAANILENYLHRQTA